MINMSSDNIAKLKDLTAIPCKSKYDNCANLQKYANSITTNKLQGYDIASDNDKLTYIADTTAMMHDAVDRTSYFNIRKLFSDKLLHAIRSIANAHDLQYFDNYNNVTFVSNNDNTRSKFSMLGSTANYIAINVIEDTLTQAVSYSITVSLASKTVTTRYYNEKEFNDLIFNEEDIFGKICKSFSEYIIKQTDAAANTLNEISILTL